MSLVAIVDYGMCNLDSIARAVEECGGTSVVTDREEDLAKAERIILPGVGAFPDAMRNIRARQLDRILEAQVIGQQIPLLGICLGMQLLAAKGWEGGASPGLGWLDAEVPRLEPQGDDRRVPHIGWNEVTPARPHPIFAGIPAGTDFYFVHSFHVRCVSVADVIATTPYCGGFASAIARDNIVGVQFHPEKSQRVGFKLLSNFLSM
jgi:glutamine amidotransferase